MNILKQLVLFFRKENRISIRKEFFVVFMLSIIHLSALAQGITVSGLIKDNNGGTMPGVSVVVKGTSTGTASDIDGRYTITVPGRQSILQFSYVSYIRQEIVVGDKLFIDVTMIENTQELGEFVVVGYGVQKKATLTGAVVSLKGTELLTTKNENVQNMLTGKLPGVRVWQRTSEPGAYDTRFDIRGMGTPLIVIDGIPRTMAEFQRLSPTDIDDIAVLKDGSAAIYGVRAANGVVLVTTRKGTKSAKPEMSYSSSFTFQMPSGMPVVSNVFQYMDIMNDHSQRNMINDKNRFWSPENYEEFRNGTRKSWDWNEWLFKDIVPQTQHNLSVTGGNDRTTYYIGAGYFYQNSIFATNDRNYHKYNVMSNMSTKILDNLTFDLQLSAISDQTNAPNQSSIMTFRQFWSMNPINGPYADKDETYTLFNQDVKDGLNPVSFLYADLIGWTKNEKKWFDGTASLTYDVPWVKGMSLKGLFGYNYGIEDFTRYQKEYDQFIYQPASETYQRYTRSSPSLFRRENYTRTQMLSQFIMNYDKVLNSNRIGVTMVWESQWRAGDNFYAQRNLALLKPALSAGFEAGQIGGMSVSDNNFYQRNANALAGRVNYAFADKYLAEFLFRYDGSSIWAPGRQWGFFPGGLIAWRVSEEDFFKNSPLGFIQNLKLRASYASTGNDASAMYQFMDGYSYPTTGGWPRVFQGGYVFNGSYVSSVNNRGIPNPFITWYKANTLNLGIDFEAWNGLFGFTLDYFSRDQTGLLATRLGGIPTVIGASMPQENLNSDRNYGLELVLTHRQRVGDFIYRTSLMGTVARRKRLDVEERAFGSSMDKWLNSQAGRLQGMYRGYGYLGHFQSWEDIWNSPVYTGRGTLPGDYIYEDWNGDGVIDGNDVHPMRFAADTPLLNFSMNFGASYKRFDLAVLLQGSAFASLQYGELVSYGNETMAHSLDRWRPVDNMVDPYDTNTQWIKGRFSFCNSDMRDNSGFNAEKIDYLRLKNIELGYTLPEFKGFDLRLYISGYNLYTLTNVIKVYDPEHPGLNENGGFMYPLNKTLSLGLTLKF